MSTAAVASKLRVQFSRSWDDWQCGKQSERAGGLGSSSLANVAVVDVPGNSLAETWGESPIPVTEHGLQFVAFAPSASSDQKGDQAAFNSLPHPSDEDVGVGEFHPEGVGEFLAFKVVP